MVRRICAGLRLKPRTVHPRIAYSVKSVAKGIRGSDQAGTTHLEAGRTLSDAAASNLPGNCSVVLILDMRLSGLSFITVRLLGNFSAVVPKVKRSNARPAWLHASARTRDLYGRQKSGTRSSCRKRRNRYYHAQP